jgi:hypothetical protein
MGVACFYDIKPLAVEARPPLVSGGWRSLADGVGYPVAIGLSVPPKTN